MDPNGPYKSLLVRELSDEMAKILRCPSDGPDPQDDEPPENKRRYPPLEQQDRTAF